MGHLAVRQQSEVRRKEKVAMHALERLIWIGWEGEVQRWWVRGWRGGEWKR